jgi:hypothetical protein
MPTISATRGVRGHLSNVGTGSSWRMVPRIQNGATVAQNGRLGEIVGHENGSHSPRAQEFVGTFIGGHLLGFVPNYILLPMLAALLLISAVKVWRHQ